MKDIILNARYGLTHKLKHIADNLWQIEFDKNSTGTYRIIGKYNDVKALDPEGGPFLSVDSTINGYKIRSITFNGIFELIKENEND